MHNKHDYKENFQVIQWNVTDAAIIHDTAKTENYDKVHISETHI